MRLIFEILSMLLLMGTGIAVAREISRHWLRKRWGAWRRRSDVENVKGYSRVQTREG
jgi:hypothetical protein